MKNKKGFTLVELVIVIIIVGILSIVAVPIYNGYVQKAYFAEGEALLGAIKTAQDIFYDEHGEYAGWGTGIQRDSVGALVTNGKDLGLEVDSSKNKYFRYWLIFDQGHEDSYGVSLICNKNGSKSDPFNADYAIIYSAFGAGAAYEIDYIANGNLVKHEERS